ncbi:MAG: hypothetical protein R3D43_15155 [Tepidamorphaceae bacterium]
MARLILTVDLIDGLLASIISDLTGKAPAAHGHAIGDITGLQSALDAKAAGSHTHAISALSDVLTTGIAIGQILMWNGTAFQPSAVPAGDWPTITNKPTDLAGFGLSAEVTALLDNLIAAAPGSLDTLNELAAALGDDPNFAATMTAALAGKADATATTAALALKAAAAIQIIAEPACSAAERLRATGRSPWILPIRQRLRRGQMPQKQ